MESCIEQDRDRFGDRAVFLLIRVGGEQQSQLPAAIPVFVLHRAAVRVQPLDVAPTAVGRHAAVNVARLSQQRHLPPQAHQFANLLKESGILLQA